MTFSIFCLNITKLSNIVFANFDNDLQVLQENDEAFRHLGIELGDLGSHSAQKGACSLATAGTTLSFQLFQFVCVPCGAWGR